MTFSNGATGTLAGINMAVSTAGSNSNVQVLSGAHLNIDDLYMVFGGSGSSNATLNVQGANSTVSQSAGSTLVVGHPSTGSAAINIGTSVGGATFSTGTGLPARILKTGAVAISSGTFNSVGDLLIDGGTLDCSNLGTFSLAAGKKLTIQNGGRATINNGYGTASNATYIIGGNGAKFEFNDPSHAVNIWENAKVNVNAGASLVALGDIHIGGATTGTLVVDGSGASVVAAGSYSAWGYAGGQANVTFSNGSTGTFFQIEIANTSSTTIANAQVLSGAHLNANALYMGGDASTTATLNVQGSGSSVYISNVTGVGNSSTGSAVINIGTTASGAGFSTGTDSFIIHKTGTVNVGGGSTTGSLITNGVILDGGILQVGAGRGVFVPTGKTISLSNAGKLKGSGNVTGNVINAGVVAPGFSPGVLPINGNYTRNATGALEIELSSIANFDRLLVSGAATLGGTLSVSPIDGFMPSAGATIDILDWTTRNGTFAVVNLPSRFLRSELKDTVSDQCRTVIRHQTRVGIVSKTLIR